MKTTTPQAAQPTPRELLRREQQRRTLRTVAIWILGPTVASAVYFAVIAPPQYESKFEITIRGAQPPQTSIVSQLGFTPGPGATTDPRMVVDFLQSAATVQLLRSKYGFDQAYSRFSLDPFAGIDPHTPMERQTAFWKHKLKADYDSAANTITLSVRAYSPEDALRLADGVLDASKDVEHTLNAQVQQGSYQLALQQVASTKHDYDAAHDKLTKLQGNVNTLTIGAQAQEMVSLVSDIDTQLATLKVSQAAVQAAFKPDAPQSKAVESQIADLEKQRTSAMGTAKTAPGPSSAEHDVLVQAALMDYQFAQKNYFAAEAALLAALPQNQSQSFVVSFVPPRLPEQSDYWKRFLNVIAVALASAVLLGVGALSYSVIKDHMQ
jgi:capsular polysaccharide transport system permease protein